MIALEIMTYEGIDGHKPVGPKPQPRMNSALMAFSMALVMGTKIHRAHAWKRSVVGMR